MYEWLEANRNKKKRLRQSLDQIRRKAAEGTTQPIPHPQPMSPAEAQERAKRREERIAYQKLVEAGRRASYKPFDYGVVVFPAKGCPFDPGSFPFARRLRV